MLCSAEEGVPRLQPVRGRRDDLCRVYADGRRLRHDLSQVWTVRRQAHAEVAQQVDLSL